VPNKTPALRLGARVRFQDRWTGSVAAIEINEDWEVYNMAVRYGFFKAVTVRLPLEPATAWDDGFLAFDDTTSAAAFARELPPIAAPSRPISRETPVSGGCRLAGLLVDRATRRAREVLLDRGGKMYRVPVAGVAFEGKTLHPGVQPDALVPYYPEDELRDRLRDALRATNEITTSELQDIHVEGSGAETRLVGNVRSKHSREAVRRAASAALGTAVNADALTDDIQLETDIGLALERAGLTRTAEVFVRCTLGDVILFGYAPSQSVADEVVRATEGQPGVRAVHNRIEIGPGSRDATPAGAAR